MEDIWHNKNNSLECKWKRSYFIWRGRYTSSVSLKQITPLLLSRWLLPLLPLKTPATKFSSDAQGLSRNLEKRNRPWDSVFCRDVRMCLPGGGALHSLFSPGESRLVLLQVHHRDHRNIQKPAKKVFPLLNLLDRIWFLFLNVPSFFPSRWH